MQGAEPDQGARVDAALARLQPRLNKYIPHRPHLKQAAFLVTPHLEVLFGGAAGGGKTDALLMAALQYVDVPGYSAVIFRRTFPQLSAADGMIERSKEWLTKTDARWNEQRKTWTFPSGATLRFAHLQHEKDKYDHQGAAYQCIIFDELTHFSETQYTYLFSRLRRLEGTDIPLRMLSGSNPGGEGHIWVKTRFSPGKTAEARAERMRLAREEGRLFIQSRLEDNPALDIDAYDSALKNLGPVEYKRLRWGDWDIEQGEMFNRLWLSKIVQPEEVPEGLRWCRFYDLAASEKTTADSTASVCAAYDDAGNLYIRDGQKGRWAYPDTKGIVASTGGTEHTKYGAGKYLLRVEAVAAWKAVSDDLATIPTLRGVDFAGVPVSGDKVSRAMPWASLAQRGKVFLVSGPWVSEFVNDAVAFPAAGRDYVDAVSGAVQVLGDETRKRSWGAKWARR